MSELLRHIQACNNAVLPGRRLPFRIAGEQVGWVLPELAARLPSLDLAPVELAAVTQALVYQGLLRWRDEAFDVRATHDGPALAQTDRGALPAFGIQAQGVHVNGMVERADGTHVWVARRAQDKKLDPGKLDHLVAGGVPAGLTAAETLVKEADEEASVPEALARQARPVSVLTYAMERAEGLRRDRLECYDLILPETFTPAPRDGEVEAFELWPLSQVLDRVRRTDDFKFNVNLVLIDLFLRHGMLAGQEAEAVRAALHVSVL